MTDFRHWQLRALQVPVNTRHRLHRPCSVHAVMPSFNVYYSRDPWSTVVTSNKKETITWCPCTPPSNQGAFGEKISASTGSSMDIAGLKKIDRYLEIAYEHILAWRIEGVYKGICIARYGYMEIWPAPSLYRASNDALAFLYYTEGLRCNANISIRLCAIRVTTIMFFFFFHFFCPID